MKIGFVPHMSIDREKIAAGTRLRVINVARHLDSVISDNYDDLKSCDVVIFQARWNDSDIILAKLLYESGIKLLFDTTDPHWDTDNFDTSAIRKRKLGQILDYISVIIFPTKELKTSFLEWRKDTRVEVLADSIDLSKHTAKKRHYNKKSFTLCWYGCRNNICQVNELARDNLEKLGTEYDVKLICVYDTGIGLEVEDFDNIELEIRDWTDEATIEAILESDVVINPRYDNWKRYKSNNKTVKAWALGVPVAEYDLYGNIKKYFQSAKLRNRDGTLGRRKAKKYDSRLIAEKLKEICTFKTDNRIAVVTAIAGGYDHLHEPTYYDSKVDNIAYIDTQAVSTNWDIREIEHTHFIQPRMTAKIYKILTHKFCPDYDWLVWADGSLVIRDSISELVDKYSSYDIALFLHRQRSCVYEEHRASLQNLNHAIGESPTVRKNQIARYKEEGLAKRSGLYECTFMLKKNTQKVQQFMEFWWGEVTSASSSDQVPFVYSLWKHPKIKVGIIKPGDCHNSKWAYYIDHDYKATKEVRKALPDELSGKGNISVTYTGKGSFNYSKIGIFETNETKTVSKEHARHLVKSHPKWFVICQ